MKKPLFHLVINDDDENDELTIENQFEDLRENDNKSNYERKVKNMSLTKLTEYTALFNNATRALNKLDPKKYLPKDTMTLKEKVDYLMRKVNDLETDNTNLRAENKRLNELVISMGKTIAELEARNAELEARNAELEAKIIVLEAKIVELKAENAKLKELLSKCTCQNKFTPKK